MIVAVCMLGVLAVALALVAAQQWSEAQALRDELTAERARRRAEARAIGRPVRGANGRYVKARA